MKTKNRLGRNGNKQAPKPQYRNASRNAIGLKDWPEDKVCLQVSVGGVHRDAVLLRPHEFRMILGCCSDSQRGLL